MTVVCYVISKKNLQIIYTNRLENRIALPDNQLCHRRAGAANWACAEDRQASVSLVGFAATCCGVGILRHGLPQNAMSASGPQAGSESCDGSDYEDKMVEVALSAWRRASPKFRSIFWLLGAAATLAAMSAIIRICAAELHPFAILFFRNLFSLALMGSWIYAAGFAILRTNKVSFYTLRALVSLVAMLAWFYGVTVMPLSTATALIFTTPLFAIVGSALFLGEIVTPRRCCALLVGLVGVFVIVQPDTTASFSGVWIILICAAASGMTIVTVKFLSITERPTTIVAYLTLFLTPLSLIPALFHWSWPSLAILPWLFALALLATLSHLFLTRAYALADAGFLAPFEFSRLIFAVIFAYLLFGESTAPETWIGAAIVVLAAVWSLQGQHATVR